MSATKAKYAGILLIFFFVLLQFFMVVLTLLYWVVGRVPLLSEFSDSMAVFAFLDRLLIIAFVVSFLTARRLGTKILIEKQDTFVPCFAAILNGVALTTILTFIIGQMQNSWAYSDNFIENMSRIVSYGVGVSIIAYMGNIIPSAISAYIAGWVARKFLT